MPSPERRWRVRRLKQPIAVVFLSSLVWLGLPASIGEQGVIASVAGDRPSWLAALRAPDPGVALSPHFLAGDRAASVAARSDDAATKGGRLDAPSPQLHRALFSPVTGFLSEATREALPRVSFVSAVPVPSAPPAAPDTPNVLTARLDASAAPRPPATTARAALASMLSAYVPDRTAIEEPFRLLLGETAPAGSRAGLSGGDLDHWWSDRPLPKTITSDASRRCLAQAVYFEARGESERGQRAVAQVVVNRVKNPAYPDDVCGVVFQNRTWRNRCQFTFACDRVRDVVRNQEAWTLAKKIAGEYASGTAWLDDIGASTHYHARRVNPRWAKLMRRIKTIDRHIFYITRNGDWT